MYFRARAIRCADKGQARARAIGEGCRPALGRAFLLLLVGCLAWGCAADPFRSGGAAGFAETVELEDTPFFPQDAYHCGPAALATLLADSGVGVDPDELVPKVWIPARRGALQPEMLAAGREYDRIPYVLPPELPALLNEVAAGRPVLVLQNLGIRLVPIWHYAVVVGFSPEKSEIILRSGTDARRVTPAKVFARTWGRSENWAAVLLRPPELPANDDVHGFLRAVAAVESAGYAELAEAAYASAVERWPESHVAWLGRGNAALALGEARRAEHMYRHALSLAPENPVTLNNLATAIAEQGRCSEAGTLLQDAIEAARDSEMAGLLAQSNAGLAGC